MSVHEFRHALLPTGWASNVRITAENGLITHVESDVETPGLTGIALPGMPNVHSHSFQRGMAGLAETKGPSRDSFWTWRQVMYHFLDRLGPDDVEAIAAFAFMEMLEGGFTAVGEFHYLHHAVDGSEYADIGELSGRIVAAAAATGIGLTLLPVLYSYSGFGRLPPEREQRRFVNDIERFAVLLDRARDIAKDLPGAVVGVAPHSLRAVDVWSLSAAAELAEGTPIHIHVAEQTKEVDDCVVWSGARPVELLLDSCSVDDRWCLIHTTHLVDDEIALIAKRRAVVGLCPITEASLGDGLFPADQFIDLDGSIAIGTDSNIEIDASAELKLLEYGQRLRLRRRNILAPISGGSAGRGLYDRALAGGTKALGRPIGLLEAGRRADMVVLDETHIALEGRTADQWLDCYVFAGGTSTISKVIVGGKDVVSQGRHHHRDIIVSRYREVIRSLMAGG